MFCLSAMSANLRRSGIDPNEKVRIDKTIGTLVYTRHASRFLTSFLLLMPFALWESAGSYWNHWITIPEAYALSFFLFGIEEIGIQTEEPFGILPIEAFCDAAIAATMNGM